MAGRGVRWCVLKGHPTRPTPGERTRGPPHIHLTSAAIRSRASRHLPALVSAVGVEEPVDERAVRNLLGFALMRAPIHPPSVREPLDSTQGARRRPPACTSSTSQHAGSHSGPLGRNCEPTTGVDSS
jgi:hypothetical protein